MEGYDFSKSTAANRAGSAGAYGGPHAEVRATLDYGWHTNPTRARQAVQDAIVEGILAKASCAADDGRPWLVFTAGPMGAGKTHLLRWLCAQGIVDTSRFVLTDVDRVRRLLPEWHALLAHDPNTAGEMTQKESGLVVEVAQAAALARGLPLIIDGCLRDVDWWRGYIERIRTHQALTLPLAQRHRIAIWNVVVSDHVAFARAARRAAVSGRVVPRHVLAAAIEQVPRSVAALTPLVDVVTTFCTDDDSPLPPRLVGCTGLGVADARKGESERGAGGTQRPAPTTPEEWGHIRRLFSKL